VRWASTVCGSSPDGNGDPLDPSEITGRSDYERVAPARSSFCGTTSGKSRLESGVVGSPEFRAVRVAKTPALGRADRWFQSGPSAHQGNE